ncbi:MAG: helix-turn-helix transcriptional regulator [Umezawaea sp.]
MTTVHRADFHQVFLITAGTGVTMVDFVDRPCSPGTLVHVAPGRVLRVPRPTDPATAVEAVVVLFTPAFPPPLDRTAALLSSFGPVAWAVPPGEREALARTVGELGAEYRRAVGETAASSVTIDLLRQLLGVLLLRVARLAAADDDTGTTGADVVRRFRQELERSFTTTRNAADYASRVGYSLRTLNRACQEATGRTAKALVDARVALEAKRLLAHTDLPVAAIARRLGFTEPTNFGKFFTREVGDTPGAFRTREHA